MEDLQSTSEEACKSATLNSVEVNVVREKLQSALLIMSTLSVDQQVLCVHIAKQTLLDMENIHRLSTKRELAAMAENLICQTYGCSSDLNNLWEEDRDLTTVLVQSLDASVSPSAAMPSPLPPLFDDEFLSSPVYSNSVLDYLNDSSVACCSNIQPMALTMNECASQQTLQLCREVNTFSELQMEHALPTAVLSECDMSDRKSETAAALESIEDVQFGERKSQAVAETQSQSADSAEAACSEQSTASEYSDCNKSSKCVNDNTATSSVFWCLQCYEPLQSEQQMAEHYKRHNESQQKLIHCELCSFATKYRQSFGRHQLICHRKLQPNASTAVQSNKYICELCEKVVGSLHALKEHKLLRHSQSGSFQCATCQKTFKLKRTLRRHERLLHSTPKLVIPCNICIKTFTLFEHFKRHMIRVHNTKLQTKI